MIGSDARWRRWRSPVWKRVGPPGCLVTSRQVALASKNSSAAEVGAGWSPQMLWVETRRLTDTRAAHFSVVSGKLSPDFPHYVSWSSVLIWQISPRPNVKKKISFFVFFLRFCWLSYFHCRCFGQVKFNFRFQNYKETVNSFTYNYFLIVKDEFPKYLITDSWAEESTNICTFMSISLRLHMKSASVRCCRLGVAQSGVHREL